ncbi:MULTISPECIES: HAD-IIIC family phosphatase [Frankia]|uniref:Uncharacterized protein n=1 Tax=Frankia alni (strain DSM 45986 / CECT 9034 / ACN14a) TaxID=326424 RepID=Q0RIF8_FRAAA|nr:MULTISPECIES: HAD-IIIC family phosphatase [Frankia]CAJ62711.1 hypothetical protein FRAAL4069 [Frankia alni ACN14a]
MNSAEALAEVRSLHRAGLLADRYPALGPLLGAVTGPDALAAARLVAGVDPDAVRRIHPDLPAVTVTITGHGTVNLLQTALAGQLARHGLVPRIRVADFDSYVFELGDPASALYAEQPDIVLCVLDQAAVFDEVAVPFTVDDVERVLTEKLALWTGLVERYRASGSGVLVLNTVPLPRYWSAQLLDHPARARLGAAWRSANAQLLGLGAAAGPVTVLDLDPIVASGVAVVEPRFEAYARAHLSDALLAAYAREVSDLVRARGGRTRKVLAVDLDETLWGGVLGDDGVEGVEVGTGYRGEAFARFQRLVRQLQSQGVLLAAVSKNDQDTVLAALREHPGMVLREEDFVRVIANWAPKPGNLRDLARDLNVGLDSVVFVDDSQAECAAVAAELPEVSVIGLDGEPALHGERLLADGWFVTTELTVEDRARTRLYHEESARTEFLSAAGSAEEFLNRLGVSVVLERAGEADLARLSQLTLRTNQFNLTTERRSQSDVRAFAADPAARVLSIVAADRFGSNGTVGALFVRARPDGLHIENFLLSCRVFARGIEQACLGAVLRAAREAGHGAVHGEYRRTAKNGKVADLYPHYGFAVETASEGLTSYRHSLVDIVPVPVHLSLTVGSDIVPDSQ